MTTSGEIRNKIVEENSRAVMPTQDGHPVAMKE
jgi:hypothetical protein